MKLAALKISVFCCLLVTANWQLACSIPKLESPQCAEAGDQVKEFYSWYLGTDAEQRTQEMYQRFISPNFPKDRGSNWESDPYFLSTSLPTTFKIGKCELKDDAHARVQVQLYWRLANKTDQKEVYADVVRSGDRWLIEKVEGQ